MCNLHKVRENVRGKTCAGKRARLNHDSFWFCISLVEKLAHHQLKQLQNHFLAQFLVILQSDWLLFLLLSIRV